MPGAPAFTSLPLLPLGPPQELRKDFDSLLTSIFEETSGLSKDDLKKLKEAAFGPQTFWVTETLPLAESERTGVTIRGNLRKDRDTVFAAVCDKTKELFGAWPRPPCGSKSMLARLLAFLLC